MRLLSVDFDYFFHEDPMWSWDHHENFSEQLANVIWHTRAADFITHDKPLPELTGQQRDFWSRVTLPKRARVYIDESHDAIRHLFDKPWDEIVSVDAHHDAGYDIKRRGRAPDCGNWVLDALNYGATVQVLYPTWRHQHREGRQPRRGGLRIGFDTGGHLGKFDAVFVCRSGAWVPPWCDQDWSRFILIDRPGVAHTWRGLPPLRVFDRAMAEQMARPMRDMIHAAAQNP